MRLIDADALEDKVADLYTEGEEATESDKVVNDVIDLIDNAPTVEYQGEECVNIKMSEEDKQKLLSALRNARVTGVVEPERPQGDLISRTWLKEHKFTTQVCNGLEIEDVDVVGVATIDNALTVDTYTEDDIHYAIKEGHQVGYEMAKAKHSPKTGHWIWNECQIYCSECREVCYDDAPKDRMNYPLNNYCPNCGAKMMKEAEK